MVSAVGVLDRAVLILDALEQGPRSLAQLTVVTGLARATVHRLATALEAHDLVTRDGEGRFTLGGRLADLGAAVVATRGLQEVAGPALESLRATTTESVQLFVRRGDQRVCVVSLESPHSLRTIVPVGAALPLDRGSAGRALTAGRAGAWVESVEEREKGVTSVSAAVRDRSGAVVGAVSVSGPVERTSRTPGRRYGAAVVRAAAAIERSL